MPELPEVTTTVNGLQKVLPGLCISDVWTDLAKKKVSRIDFENTIKSEKFFKMLKKEIVGAKVKNVERRAKNILINLNNNKTILIHMKMTGHLLFGEYTKRVESVKLKVESKIQWEPKDLNSPLNDPYNRFIHVVFTLGSPLRHSGTSPSQERIKHLVFCDSRKFGKITLLDTATAHETKHLKGVGPEPLDKNFKFSDFKNALIKNPSAPASWRVDRRPIKQILMDQYTIAGIGNIYSDEMLWLANIHPESKINNIPNMQLKKLYIAMQKVLHKGIDFGGDSMSDYRDIEGKRGNFQNHHNVYRKKNEKCGKKNCKGVIIGKAIGGRSAHFCPKHQIKY